MSRFLVSESKPEGYMLEALLDTIRADLVRRMTLILDDERAEARHVLDNDVRILTLLSDAIRLAEDNSRTLLRAFGPSMEGKPRIGAE